jgi:uncharacterized membrane protein YdjX (TVP38/TMEM64 family)
MKPLSTTRKTPWWFLSLIGLLVALGLLYLWRGEEIALLVKNGLSEDAHPGVVLLLFAGLPLVGFPITVLLVLIGLKFGAVPGILIMFAVMPIHLLAAFLMANSFLRALIERLFRKMDHRLPQVPLNRSWWFSLVFMAVPGLPYTVKNLTLALCGVPFRHFFGSALLVEGVMGIPFVVTGQALASKSLMLLVVVFLVLAGAYAAFLALRRRHREILSPPVGSCRDPDDAHGG